LGGEEKKSGERGRLWRKLADSYGAMKSKDKRQWGREGTWDEKVSKGEYHAQDAKKECEGKRIAGGGEGKGGANPKKKRPEGETRESVKEIYK